LLIKDGGANVNIRDRNNDTPLIIYCKNEIVDLSILEYLIDNGANVNSKNNSNETSLTISCKKEPVHYDIINYLIDKGANIIPEENNNEVSALSIAEDNNNKKLIKFLVDKIKQMRDDNDTQLTFECKLSNIDKIKTLIQYGFDINEYNKEGDTPLTIAFKLNNTGLVKCLLDNGSNVNQPSKYGFSPLIIACYLNDNEDLINYLIKKGANINENDNWYYHNTPLLIARRLKYTKIEDILIKNKADERMPDMEGTSYNDIITNTKKLNEESEIYSTEEGNYNFNYYYYLLFLFLLDN